VLAITKLRTDGPFMSSGEQDFMQFLWNSKASSQVLNSEIICPVEFKMNQIDKQTA